MPLRVHCPECRTPYTLADNLRGKQVRCKNCQNSFPARPAPADDAVVVAEVLDQTGGKFPPRQDDVPTLERSSSRSRRPRRDEDDTERSGKRAGLSPWPWVVGGAALLLLFLVVIGGGIGALLLLRARVKSVAPPPVAIEVNPPRHDNVPPPANPANPNPALNPPLGQPAPRPNPAVQPPPAPVAWNVTPDPVAQPAQIPDDVQGTIPFTGFNRPILFPSTPSAFVLVGQQANFADTREVWNLQTLKRVGTIDNRANRQDLALSPDGTLVVGRLNGATDTTVEVLSAETGQSVARVVVDPKFALLRLLDFAGPGQLVTAKPQGLDLLVQLWDIKTGAEVHRFQAPCQTDHKLMAFSPGRRYLALFHHDDDKVLVYDLTTGNLAGQAPLNNRVRGEGLAFAPDGKTLAALCQVALDGRLTLWDVARGTVKAEHHFPKDLQTVAQNAFGYEGQTLEWLPDGNSLLVSGQLLLDSQSGKQIWTIPTETGDSSPRQVLTASRVARVKKEGASKALVLDVLPQDKLTAAAQAARTGQDPAAAQLPAAKAADWSAVRTLPAPVGVAAWKAQADPAPAPRSKLGTRPIPLAGKAGDLARILFAGPDVGQAVVLTATAPNELGARKQVRADRYDLQSGQHLGGSDLFVVEPPRDKPFNLDADVSPDGSALVVKEPHDGRRVDVWSLAEGKHLVGWVPYQKEADATVKWVSFLDAQRVLTLSGGGQLTLWSLPECRAVYTASNFRDVPALSPGRKYLTAFNGSTYEVLEAASGERQGQLVGPNLTMVVTAAFRPDGQQFAALVRGPDLRQSLARWDATTGAYLGDFPVVSSGTQMEWLGKDYLLCGMTLVDLERKWALFNYLLPGPGRDALGSPDGRHWFASAASANLQPVLTAETLPDARANQLAREVRPVLAPGMTVTVRVEGATPPRDANFQQQASAGLSARLQAQGFQVGPNGDAVLLVQVQPERDTGKVMKLEAVGAPRQIIDVHVKELVCQATLTDRQGTQLWQQKGNFQTPDFIGILHTEDAQATLDQAVWKGCSNWLGSVPVPSLVIRTSSGVEVAPKSLTLTGDR